MLAFALPKVNPTYVTCNPESIPMIMDFTGYLTNQQLEQLRRLTQGTEPPTERVALTCLALLRMTIDETIAKRNARANQE